MGKKRVFLDTNIIIESHRTGCWKALAGSYDLHTVERVVTECLKGRKTKPGYVPIDARMLEKSMTVHQPDPLDIVEVSLLSQGEAVLDEGERDLLAYLRSHYENTELLTTADRAAVRIACALGFSDIMVSLESLIRSGHPTSPLRPAYITKTLTMWKTQYRMDHLGESGNTPR